LTAIDGPDTSHREPSQGNRSAGLVLAAVWERVREAERGVLDSTTIAQLVAQASPHEWTI
jgi:Rrf2 family transcriptional regulator, cysteine metabolism repressor